MLQVGLHLHLTAMCTCVQNMLVTLMWDAGVREAEEQTLHVLLSQDSNIAAL